MGLFDFGSNRFVFDSLGGWSEYAYKAVIALVKGVVGLVLSVVVGIFTVLSNIYAFFARYIRMRPMLSVAVTIVVTNFVSLSLIMNVMVRAKTYEHQRDSISYELMMYKQPFVTTDTLVVVKDSVYVYRY